MPDVFISYKKEERETAARLATRLTEAGYDVWWDAALLAGDRFEDEIATVLRASRAVIVLWSKLSVGSDWVKAEAEAARAQKKALPAAIDDVQYDSLPLLFQGIHVVRLIGWQGEDEHPGYRELMAAVSDRLGEGAGPQLTAPQAEQKLAQSIDEAEVWSAIAASPHPSAEEYRSYLKRFGKDARFAELAEIRIARLEAEEAERKAGKVVRRKWAPAIVLPLLALLLVAIAGGWFWSRGDLRFIDDMMIPGEARAAAARCTDWLQSGDTEWETTLPRLTGNVAADCELAVKTFPTNGDYKGMLAAVRLVQGESHFPQALNLVHEGTALGSPVAETITGVMYHYDMGVNGSFKLAGDHFKAAADKGNADAAARLCWLAIDVQFSPEQGAWGDPYPYCTKAGDANSPLGLAAMGYILDRGQLGSRTDPIKAADFYERAVALGHPLGKIGMALLLFDGLGVPRDDARAVQLLNEARAAGYPEAMRWLGVASERGTGLPQNMAQAGRYYEDAYQRRDFAVSALLGFTFPSVNPGYLARIDIVRMQTGALDDPIVLRVNGVIQTSGFIVPINDNSAKRNFEACAATNIFCGMALGYFLKFGPPEFRDVDRARTLFQAAADAGELHAQYEMGVFHELGEGIPVDLDEAARYFKLAADQGSVIARDRLYSLAGGNNGQSQAVQSGG